MPLMCTPYCVIKSRLSQYILVGNGNEMRIVVLVVTPSLHDLSIFFLQKQCSRENGNDQDARTNEVNCKSLENYKKKHLTKKNIPCADSVLSPIQRGSDSVHIETSSSSLSLTASGYSISLIFFDLFLSLQ